MLDIEKLLSKLIAIPTSPISRALRLLCLFMFEYFNVLYASRLGHQITESGKTTSSSSSYCGGSTDGILVTVLKQRCSRETVTCRVLVLATQPILQTW